MIPSIHLASSSASRTVHRSSLALCTHPHQRPDNQLITMPLSQLIKSGRWYKPLTKSVLRSVQVHHVYRVRAGSVGGWRTQRLPVPPPYRPTHCQHFRPQGGDAWLHPDDCLSDPQISKIYIVALLNPEIYVNNAAFPVTSSVSRNRLLAGRVASFTN